MQTAPALMLSLIVIPLPSTPWLQASVSYIDPELRALVTVYSDRCYVKVPSGDFDSDGKVSIRDALLAFRCVVYNETPGDVALQQADMNLNNMIDIGDVVVILRTTVGLV